MLYIQNLASACLRGSYGAAVDRSELVGRSEELRSKLLSMADELEQFINAPQYDETYKLEWYPKLIPEHFDEVERVVNTLTETFDTLLRTP